jgi:hypothetical protein
VAELLPVDRVFALVREAVPDAKFERLRVTFPAGDDNVWWVWVGPEPRTVGQRSVQIDTHPDGTPPFFIEGDDEPRKTLTTSDASQAAEAIVRWL